jgi:hypothetical protein
MSGLDFIILTFIKSLISDPAKIFAIILPVGMVLEKYLDNKIKERNKR